MATKTTTFNQPKEHLFFKSAFNYGNMIKTEIQLRKLEKDINDLDSYINICTKKRNELEKIRKECVSWRLKHSRIK